MKISTRSLFGSLLVITGGVLFFFVMPIVLHSFGLLAASIVAVLFISLAVLGYLLIVRSSVKQLVESLLSIFVVVLVLWIVVLPLALQILFGSFLVVCFILSFRWYYRKYGPRNSSESDKEK